jgi:hypothetical protein
MKTKKKDDKVAPPLLVKKHLSEKQLSAQYLVGTRITDYFVYSRLVDKSLFIQHSSTKCRSAKHFSIKRRDADPLLPHVALVSDFPNDHFQSFAFDALDVKADGRRRFKRRFDVLTLVPGDNAMKLFLLRQRRSRRIS